MTRRLNKRVRGAIISIVALFLSLILGSAQAQSYIQISKFRGEVGQSVCETDGANVLVALLNVLRKGGQIIFNATPRSDDRVKSWTLGQVITESQIQEQLQENHKDFQEWMNSCAADASTHAQFESLSNAIEEFLEASTTSRTGAELQNVANAIETLLNGDAPRTILDERNSGSEANGIEAVISLTLKARSEAIVQQPEEGGSHTLVKDLSDVKAQTEDIRQSLEARWTELASTGVENGNNIKLLRNELSVLVKMASNLQKDLLKIEKMLELQISIDEPNDSEGAIMGQIGDVFTSVLLMLVLFVFGLWAHRFIRYRAKLDRVSQDVAQKFEDVECRLDEQLAAFGDNMTKSAEQIQEVCRYLESFVESLRADLIEEKAAIERNVAGAQVLPNSGVLRGQDRVTGGQELNNGVHADKQSAHRTSVPEYADLVSFADDVTSSFNRCKNRRDFEQFLKAYKHQQVRRNKKAAENVQLVESEEPQDSADLGSFFVLMGGFDDEILIPSWNHYTHQRNLGAGDGAFPGLEGVFSIRRNVGSKCFLIEPARVRKASAFFRIVKLGRIGI
ncbi:hypothetical protein EOI86_22645 [Hwanghaeella grinnelliae]|uniref:Uncharacterized protein n=1 Tax=Hwanghaeella grinnelliae TaxID=2500179 RepID=A0A437QHY1_9PROT|nr:hypothetical protein [Hwanghaeella grinnelliae]RVU33930.1 hypothetical protein EOI86_22645 [Hwanghaeella grinnelliae]